ncbi:hypothetical protein GLYMA_09G174100v4 [Glycine max]|uniref:Uncharacterized protein n=1 Tax=Glycine max TaxID=3847 RepID=I1L441_SOYBN|nr:hypothetical protein GYH30_025346 [Glycine max]KRH39043.1 hypothetical protein GLYMA_09G174100v4 [Glycine max]
MICFGVLLKLTTECLECLLGKSHPSDSILRELSGKKRIILPNIIVSEHAINFTYNCI